MDSDIIIDYLNNINDKNGFGNISSTEGVVISIGDYTIVNMNERIKIGFAFDKDDAIIQIVKPDDIYIISDIREIDFPYIYFGDPVFITIPAYPHEDYGTLTGYVDKKYQDPTEVNSNAIFKCEIRFTNLQANKDIQVY